MLGTLQAEAEAGELVITRFRTRRVGLLLAYLAYYPDRSHSREELAEMLWPDCDPEFARQNLRQALASLRRHLEPPSVPSGAVLVAKQARISLNSAHVTTDVAEFTRLLKAATSATSNARKIEKLKRAVDIYRGDLLPGYYEEWVQRERLHLEDLLVSALQSLIYACEVEGQVDEAIHFVRMALAKDHLKEDLHAALMRLYLSAERPASALQHFQEWKETLASEFGDEPGDEILDLAERARVGAPLVGGRRGNTPVAEQAAGEPEEAETIVRLPVQLTRFFGRTRERDRVVGELAEMRARLVSLLGPAGTGKTRLSIEVGRRLADDHGWNVWFVPLADYSDASLALDAVATAMRLRNEAGNGSLEVLRAHLTGRKNLLILDNLEHILEGVVPTVEALLREIPGISLLATSRQCLKLGGELEVDLDALPIPGEDVVLPQELAEFPSVQLFADRAQSVMPDFQITPHNARAIASICSHLDGLPLALEIAAGLSNAFTPSQILQNFDHPLELLRSRRRDLSSRHRSLRAAIDYSYALLTPEQQRFFAELSVFRGGFTIEAANRICLSGSGRTKAKCMRMVLDLQERSIVRSEEAAEGHPARFRLLESFREYGMEHLSAEDELSLRERHATYFFEKKRPSGTEPHADGDRENRLAALRFFVEQGRSHECVTMLHSIHEYSTVGHDTIRELARSPNFDTFDPVDQIMLLRLLADAHLYPSEFEESLRVAEQALAVSEKIGREDLVAICHRGVAVSALYLGKREEAVAHTLKFVAYADKVGDTRMIEHGYNALGGEYWSNGDFPAAFAAFESALVAATKLYGSSELPWPMLYNMARVRLDTGLLDDGMPYAAEGLRLATARGDEYGVSMCLYLVALYHRLKGNLVAALATSHEMLLKRRKAGFVYWTLNAIQGHASILVAMGRYREAATLFAASRGVTKLKRVVDLQEHESGVALARENLSEWDFEQAWAEGLAMSMDEAFRFAVKQK